MSDRAADFTGSIPAFYDHGLGPVFFVDFADDVARLVYQLLPGERCTVPPKTAHYLHGEADGPCKFLIVQGVGVYDFVPVDG